jgi:small-conductance mechanosensitive channel
MRRILFALLFAVFPILISAEVLPAPVGGAVVAASPAALESQELVFFHRKVFTFRSALMGISASDRAKRAHARIVDQLALSGDHIVTVHGDLFGFQIRIDGATSFVVTPADLNPQREDTLQQIADHSATVLRRAIAESEESRSLESLLRALGLAALATAAAAALVWLSSKARRALLTHLITATATQTERFRLAGLHGLHQDRLSYGAHLLLLLVFRVLVLVLVVEWLSFVLRCFAFTRAWGETLNDVLVELIFRMLEATAGSLPGLLAAVLIFYLAFLATRATDRFFTQVRNRKIQVNWVDPDIATPTRRITKVMVWLFALAMAYPYLPGSQTEAFKGLSVLLGLMLSLGASSLVGQAASGLILTYGRFYRKGEFVRVSDQDGSVVDLGMFTTRIRTALGEELSISNATILGGTVRNYSRAVQGDGFVLGVKVTIGYDTPWRQVHAMLEQAALRTEGVLKDPPPQVLQTALSDWYPEYQLFCHALPSETVPRAVVLSALHAHIQDVFNEYGVQMMSPQYVDDPSTPKWVPRSRWYPAPAKPPAENSS